LSLFACAKGRVCRDRGRVRGRGGHGLAVRGGDHGPARRPRAPKLRRAVCDAKWAGYAYVTLDGTLIPIDRVAADRPFYSGKHKKHGTNLQVIASPDGDVLWASGRCPGRSTARRPSGPGACWPSWSPRAWSPWPIRDTGAAAGRRSHTGRDKPGKSSRVPREQPLQTRQPSPAQQPGRAAQVPCLQHLDRHALNRSQHGKVIRRPTLNGRSPTCGPVSCMGRRSQTYRKLFLDLDLIVMPPSGKAEKDSLACEPVAREEKSCHYSRRIYRMPVICVTVQIRSTAPPVQPDTGPIRPRAATRSRLEGELAGQLGGSLRHQSRARNVRGTRSTSRTIIHEPRLASFRGHGKCRA
jgi:DDE superfamily endonuclease